MQINGLKLLRLRVKLGISQYKVSCDTGITRTTINRIESGRIKNPLFGSAAILAEYYGVTLDSLKQ